MGVPRDGDLNSVPCLSQTAVGMAVLTQLPWLAGAGPASGVKRREWEGRPVGAEAERKTQHLSLQVPLRCHSSSSSSDDNSSSSAAQPLLAGDRESPSSGADDHVLPKELLHGVERDGGQGRSVSCRAGDLLRMGL